MQVSGTSMHLDKYSGILLLTFTAVKPAGVACKYRNEAIAFIQARRDPVTAVDARRE